jgi:UDP-glucose 4-epimerase
VPYVTGTRRAGDPASLVAGADKLRRKLGCEPRSSELKTIVRHAWDFARKRA